MDITVSVLMITYNHEQYISQAIESILMQQTDFAIELVIGDDCSPDSTREICRQYQEKYPDIIRLSFPEKNLGMMKNFIQTAQACQGKYIALCDGDDYWTDPLKLQKQVDYMNRHPRCGLVYTNYQVFDQSTGTIENDALKNMPVYTGNCKDTFIWGSRGVMAVTTLIKNEALDSGYFNFSDDPYFAAVDFCLYMWVAFDFEIGYLPDETAAYRVHGNSVTNAPNRAKKWKFMRSHVYMRNKFLSEKKYRPQNYEGMQDNVFREIMHLSILFEAHPKYGIAAYRKIKKKNTRDRFILFGLYCPAMVSVTKRINRMLRRIR